MANLLYLVHRLPYPPNKGDKLRSYHLLLHLARRHRVFLGTFVDDPADQRHVPTLERICSGLCAVPLRPLAARLRSLAAVATGEALTLRYYRDRTLAEWIRDTLRKVRIDAVVVFSSSMAQYAALAPALPLLVDFVDVDSEKWRQYAETRRGPAAWLYRREARRLLAFERRIARRAERSYFVSEPEVELFRRLAPECAARVDVLGNGVDAAYYAIDAARASPFAEAHLPIVFTGAMDYPPNIDAVTWFVREVLVTLRSNWPAIRFHIVGRHPTAAVRALASEATEVTGTVPDVRPFLQHAAVVVAPLRLARGIQNKILEAMAMGRPVVASSASARAIRAEAGRELLTATTASDYVDRIGGLLRDAELAARVGRAGRQCVVERYTWDAHLARLDPHLSALVASGGATRGAAVGAVSS